MQELWIQLTEAVAATPAVALAASLAWGVLSVLLSPCHLAGIPLVVGCMDAQGRTTARKALPAALVFTGGVLATIAVLGGITWLLGRMLGDVGEWSQWVVIALFILVGLYLLGLLPLSWSGLNMTRFTRRGLFTMLLVGVLFGFALGPCTFAYMAPVLGVVFRESAARPALAAGLLLTFAVGHGGVLLAAGVFGGWVQGALRWHANSRGALWLKKACGALLLAGAAYMLLR